MNNTDTSVADWAHIEFYKRAQKDMVVTLLEIVPMTAETRVWLETERSILEQGITDAIKGQEGVQT